MLHQFYINYYLHMQSYMDVQYYLLFSDISISETWGGFSKSYPAIITLFISYCNKAISITFRPIHTFIILFIKETYDGQKLTFLSVWNRENVISIDNWWYVSYRLSAWGIMVETVVEVITVVNINLTLYDFSRVLAFWFFIVVSIALL